MQFDEAIIFLDDFRNFSRTLDKEVKMWGYWEQNTWKNWKEQNMR